MIAPLEGGYRIAPMDSLTIRVFGMEDLTGDYQVDLRGNIGMPLIGEVSAIDKSPAELDALLTAKYSEKYLENPDISVGVKAATGHSVRQAAAFDLVSIRHGEMPDPPIYTGDIVIVDGSRNKQALEKFFKTFPLLAIFRPF